MLKGLFIALLIMAALEVKPQHSALPDTARQELPQPGLNTRLSFRFSDLGSDLNIYRKSVTDFGMIFTSPFHWNREQYIKFGFMMAAGATVYALDEPFYTFINLNKTPQTEFTTKYVLEPLGNYTTFGLLAGMAGYGLVFHKERPTTTAILAAESYLLTGLVTLIPKTFAGRVRPYHTNPLSHSEFRGFMGGRSFWSGHTATVFSVAAVIGEMYKDKKMIPFIAYATATLAGISRIHDMKHWPSDVFLGAIVGAAIGKMVVKSYKSSDFSFAPSFGPDQQGVYMSFSF